MTVVSEPMVSHPLFRAWRATRNTRKAAVIHQSGRATVAPPCSPSPAGMASPPTLYRAALLLGLVAAASGHGAMTFPRPRNSLDGDLPQWEAWKYPCDAEHQGMNCSITFCENGHNCQGSCPITSRIADDPEALDASNGQSCYWFSNGCTIGCDACDGTNNHFGHGAQRFTYNNLTSVDLLRLNLTIPDPWNPARGQMVLDPKSTKGLSPGPNCEPKRPVKATICDSRLRTVNTQAECGSPEDFYYYSPWRAPGSAPVIDSCGVAGGRFPGQGTGGAGAQFQNTSVATQGEKGSRLPAMPPQATYKAGSLVEVGWTVMANHGKLPICA